MIDERLGNQTTSSRNASNGSSVHSSTKGAIEMANVEAVDTDAVLATIVGSYDGAQALTAGRSATYDGGGRHWVWDAASTATPTAACLAPDPGVPGRWLLLPGSGCAVALCIDDYGGDGSGTPGSETANNAALLAMQAVAEASGADSWTFSLGGPGKRYLYSQNKWANRVAGSHDFVLDLNGSELRYTYAGPFTNTTNMMICTPDINYVINAGMAYPGLAQATPWPMEIQTVLAGADRLYMVTPSDALNIAVGEVFFIGGYERQPGGDPQNFQFFQWGLECASRDGSTGEVVFKVTDAYSADIPQRVDHTMRADWPDHNHNINYPSRGKARLYKIVNRSNASGFTYSNMLRSILIKNGTMNSGGAYKDHRVHMNAWQFVRWENVRSNISISALATRHWSAVNLQTPDCEWEIDKDISICSIDNCVGSWLGGANVPSLSVKSSEFQRIYSQAGRTTLTDVTVGPYQQGTATPPIEIDGEAVLNGVLIRTGVDDGPYITSYMKSGQSGRPVYVLGTVTGSSITISSPPQTGAGCKPMAIGMLMVKTDGSYHGRVLGATGGYPSASILYQVQWSDGATPTVGHEFYVFRDFNFSVRGCQSPTGWQGAADPYAGVYSILGPPPGDRTSYILQSLYMPGKVRKVVIDIDRAGTMEGVAPPRIFIQNDNGSTTLAVVDMRYVGTRVVRSDGAFGAVSGSADNLSGHTLFTNYYPTLRLSFSGIHTDPSLRPKFRLSIYYNPITV